MERPINRYCLPFLADCTPNVDSDFDLTVREFCKQKSGQQQQQPQPQLQHDKMDSPLGLDRFEPSKTTSGQQYHHYASVKNVPHNCKVIVTGDVAVGKTSLINRFGYDVYSSHYKTTIGVDFDVQKFKILGLPYVLQIWDTAGLERFKCITSSYYRGCQVAVIVFDMSNLETLNNAIKWRDEIIDSCQTFDQLSQEQESYNHQLIGQQEALIRQKSLPLIFLVGSKMDLIDTNECNQQFVQRQAKIIANRMQAELWCVSAQTGDQVNELFYRIATVSFNRAVMREMLIARYEASTLGVCLKQKIIQQQKDLWRQGKLIKITRKKKGDERRTKCINIQCVIK